MSNDTLTHSVTFTEAPATLTVVVDPTPQITRGRAVVVERRRPKAAGWSLLQGLGVVVDHWRKSFRKLEDPTQIAGTFTTEYPEERLPLPEAYRNMPILLFDDATGHELCTSCFQCQRICPPQVIHMTQAKDPETGKPVPAVSEFIIEYDACMSCGFCAEVCPFDAIKMDHNFELSTADHSSLTVHKAGLLRPVSYYQSIAPTFWAEAEASAYKKLEANKKRRPASIGIAPQMIEQVKAAHELRDDQQEADSPPAPVATAPDAGQAAPVASKAAPAASDGDLPTDKAARLAAIRARNEAKKAAAQPATAVSAEEPQPAAEGAATALTTPDAPPALATPDAPLDEKAARLAAIRARNAAKKAAQAEEE